MATNLNSEYTITAEDIYVDSLLSNGPAIRAAANPDPRVLKAILAFKCKDTSEFYNSQFTADALSSGFFHRVWNTPLLQAIASQLSLNVQTLLDAGADPNGISIESLADYALLFYRFRPWRCWEGFIHIFPEPSLRGDALFSPKTQGVPVTSDEISKRFTGLARFWAEAELIPLNKYRNGDAMHSLIAAAKEGHIEIFNQVYAAGADASFWQTPLTAMPEAPTPSSLAVSTPLHAAISSGHAEMVQHLLSLNFSPNAMALSTRSQALTPLQAALTTYPPNLPIYSILASHPLTEPQTLTPIYQVHTLHFAVAQLSLPLLETLLSPSTHQPPLHLSSAHPTVLGHTLLHIACLPLTDLDIQLFALKPYTSIHELRTFDRNWRPVRLQPRCEGSWPPHGPWDGYADPPLSGSTLPGAPRIPYICPPPLTKEDVFPLPSTDGFAAQTAIVRYLLASETQDMAAQDVHGNTALHYLAGQRIVNKRLVDMLLEDELGSGKRVWETVRNRWGWTAKELWEDGIAAVEEPHKAFWKEAEEEVSRHTVEDVAGEG